MMVRKVTLVKYWRKPSSALTEAREQLEDRLTAGKWRSLTDLELVFPLAVRRTRAVSSPSRKEPWADGTAVALGTAAHTSELHVELAGGPGSSMSAVQSQGHPFSQMATHVAHVHCATFEFFVFFKKWTMHFYCTEFAFPFPLKVCMYFTVICFIGVDLGPLLFLMSYW